MNKRSVVLIFALFFAMAFFSSGVLADNHTSILEEVEAEYENAELENAGLKPGDTFYAVDEFFDKFSDDVKVKEEKFAEYLELKEQGDEESAQKALNKYNLYAEKIEEEIDPEKRSEARRSAAAIKRAVGEKEGFEEVLDKEERLVTAAEIAGKIKGLCEELALLDPEKYYETCSAGEDSPDWQVKLDKDLTGNQREEAKKFGKIMGQCFRTSGQDCACEEIPFPEFANACQVAAPLAVKCDVEGDEEACEELESFEMPELPAHLQDVLDELDEASHDRFENHMPRECEEAGAKSPKDCQLIMITTHAPEECREKLISLSQEGEVNERVFRETCDKIMMEFHAPECAAEGITNPRDCEEFMFKNNAPIECQEKGVSNPRECRKLMEGREGFSPQGIQRDCRSIQDPKERLDCFDGLANDVGMQAQDFRNIRQKENECRRECSSQARPWSFYEGECECGEPGQHYDGEGNFIGGENFEEFRNPAREEFREGEEFYRQEGERRFEDDRYREEFKEEYREEFKDEFREQFKDESHEEFREDFNKEEPKEEFKEPESPSTSELEKQESSTSEPKQESLSEGSSSGATITGNFITGNAFLDYRFRKRW